MVAVGEGACRARNEPVSSEDAVIQGKGLLLLLLPVAGVAAKYVLGRCDRLGGFCDAVFKNKR